MGWRGWDGVGGGGGGGSAAPAEAGSPGRKEKWPQRRGGIIRQQGPPVTNDPSPSPATSLVYHHSPPNNY